MKTTLTSKEEIIDGEKVMVWHIDKGDGAILININKVLEEEISECTWLGKKSSILEVCYCDWDSMELTAILNDNGQIIKKGVVSIDTYIEEEGLFVVSFSGYGLGEEALNYSLAIDDCKMAVIDTYGRFIIGPIYNKIEFDENENIFYAKNYTGAEIKYTLTGKIIE